MQEFLLALDEFEQVTSAAKGCVRYTKRHVNYIQALCLGTKDKKDPIRAENSDAIIEKNQQLIPDAEKLK